MRIQRITLVLVLVLLPAAATSAQDVYIEQFNKYSGSAVQGNDNSGLTKMWISGSAIRIEGPDGKMIYITDLEKEEMITLDLEKNQYFVIPLEQVRNNLLRTSARMKQQLSMSWRVEETNELKKISGYNCQAIRFYGRGTVDRGQNVAPLEITIEFWLSEEPGVSLDIYMKLMETIGLQQNPFVDQRILSELKRLKGFIIQSNITSKIDGRHNEIEQTVREIRKVEMKPGRYLVPEGFTLVKNPMTK